MQQVKPRRARKAEEGTGQGHLVLVIKMASKGPLKFNAVAAVRNSMDGGFPKGKPRL